MGASRVLVDVTVVMDVIVDVGDVGDVCNVDVVVVVDDVVVVGNVDSNNPIPQSPQFPSPFKSQSVSLL